MLRKKRKNLEQIKIERQHYQGLIATASPQGKQLLQAHLKRLEDELQKLSQTPSKLS